MLRLLRRKPGRRKLTTELTQHLPARLVKFLNAPLAPSGKLGDPSDAQLDEICTTLRAWLLMPNGSDGYRTAEVTLSSIHTDAL